MPHESIEVAESRVQALPRAWLVAFHSLWNQALRAGPLSGPIARAPMQKEDVRGPEKYKMEDT